jgi:hypothetical protein
MEKIEEKTAHTPEEIPAEDIDLVGYEGIDSNGMARPVAVNAESITFLRSQVEHWQKQAEEAGRQVKIWREALRSAQEQRGEPTERARSTQAPSTGRGIKTAFVRKLIRESGKGGIAPREIKERAVAESVPLGGNFPYTTLAKLKGRGEIQESGGKYSGTELLFRML